MQSVGSDRVRSRRSGEKGAEGVLPSWRSMRSLAIKETAHGLPSGNLALNIKMSRCWCAPWAWVARLRETLSSAKGAGAMEKQAVQNHWHTEIAGCIDA